MIRSANDESESMAVVDRLYRLAGIYNTCVICVLHFVPNGVKLRLYIGSELRERRQAFFRLRRTITWSSQLSKLSRLEMVVL